MSPDRMAFGGLGLSFRGVAGVAWVEPEASVTAGVDSEASGDGAVTSAKGVGGGASRGAPVEASPSARRPDPGPPAEPGLTLAAWAA
ncbi:MAG: hypothetical protein AMXMBFR64_48740 [Myxococcales bacterium]